jgi:hypothetical protein
VPTRPAGVHRHSEFADVWRLVDQDAELTAAATMAITATAGFVRPGTNAGLHLFQVPVARTDHGTLALITDIEGALHIVFAHRFLLEPTPAGSHPRCGQTGLHRWGGT